MILDFQKKDWQFRDLITEGELNRMEDGIEEGVTKAEQAQTAADQAWDQAVLARSIAELHAGRHATGGADPLTPEMIGAETPAGAQEKADQAEANAKLYADGKFLPASQYTAADILNKLKTVDGAGSGLDADLLDGMDSSNYMRKVSMPPGNDLNNFTTPNAFITWDTGGGAVYNTPYGTLAQGSARVFVVRNWGPTGSRITQEYIEVYPRDIVERRWIRNYDGQWGNWYLELNTKNSVQTRINSGTLEYNDGGTWKRESGAKIIPFELPATEYITTSTSAGNRVFNITGMTGSFDLIDHQLLWSSKFTEGGRNAYFEVMLNITGGGTGFAALGSIGTTYGQVSTTISGYGRLRSAAMNIPNGTPIWVTAWCTSGTVKIARAQIVIE